MQVGMQTRGDREGQMACRCAAGKSLAAAAIAITTLVAPAPAQLFDFPTDNRALIDGRPEEFYMYVNRNFQGKKSTPWTGGQYGYTRNPAISGGKTIYRRHHEGIDIKPVRRDANGEPLDMVTASADGVVVHASSDPRASNYGRYIVVEHQIQGSPFYTLYAHLGSVVVEPGQRVRQGQDLGRLGYTGAGINRTRAHVHFEIAMMQSRNFNGWYDDRFPTQANVHKLFNGMNLAGLNPEEILKLSHQHPRFSLIDYIRTQEPFFKIHIPNTPNLSILKDYPWLAGSAINTNPPTWTVAFSKYGTPISAEPYPKRVSKPTVAWARPSDLAYSHVTRGIIGGPASNPELTSSGERFVKLLTWPAESGQ